MSLQLQTGSSFYDMQLNGQRTNVAATLKTGHNIVRIDYLWWGFIFFLCLFLLVVWLLKLPVVFVCAIIACWSYWNVKKGTESCPGA